VFGSSGAPPQAAAREARLFHPCGCVSSERTSASGHGCNPCKTYRARCAIVPKKARCNIATTETERLRRILEAREHGDSAGERLSFNLRTGRFEGQGGKGLDGQPTEFKPATKDFSLGG